MFRGFGRGHCWGGDQQYTVAAAVAVTCCASCSAVDDRFEALVSHNGLDRAVHVRVPDVRAEDARQRGLAEAPLADDAALRDRYRTRLADPALEPYDECTGCTSACLFRRRSQSIMSETGTGKAFLDLITEHGWARGADRATSSPAAARSTSRSAWSSTRSARRTHPVAGPPRRTTRPPTGRRPHEPN